jgi:hypothetical protein
VVVGNQNQNQKENDMNKTVVMKNFLKTNGGEFIKDKGRWYWKKEGEPLALVTLSFLRTYKPTIKVEEPKKEEPKVEVKKEIKKFKPKKTTEIVNDETPIISEISDENI